VAGRKTEQWEGQEVMWKGLLGEVTFSRELGQVLKHRPKMRKSKPGIT
jgi:hypothetical protein